MTWIGRDCDLIPPGKGSRSQWPSEFMTWIGRDCDRSGRFVGFGRGLNQNLWPELEGIVTSIEQVVLSVLRSESEFMTWIGRDCDFSMAVKDVFRTSTIWIRIYDLNWKGLWLIEDVEIAVPETGIRIYDLNWKGLWLFSCNSAAFDPGGSEFMTWIGRDCDSWWEPVYWEKNLNQNLWPELEGIVTRHRLRGLRRE